MNEVRKSERLLTSTACPVLLSSPNNVIVGFFQLLPPLPVDALASSVNDAQLPKREGMVSTAFTSTISAEGCTVGDLGGVLVVGLRVDGMNVGLRDGRKEGTIDGTFVGATVGPLVRAIDGNKDGNCDGASEGVIVGPTEGTNVGISEGNSVGSREGVIEGVSEGK